MSTRTEGTVGSMAPISLTELVEQAELLTRVDRKYILVATEADRLIAAMRDQAQVLEIDGRRGFGYRSTYLDTPERDSFLISGRSQRRRWKVRTRTYLDSGTSWLEVKTVIARGQTLKQRIQHPEVDPTHGLNDDGRAFVADVIGTGPSRHLDPVLVTTYRRTTLYLPGSGARVTVDVDLGWACPSGTVDLDRPSLVVVETKTGSTPSPVDRLLWSYGHRPVRMSKFGVGMAALHPDLPRLKWHRVLHHHLGLPRSA
jgi:hypothetical protein